MLPPQSPTPPDMLAAVAAATTRGVAVTLDVRWYGTVSSTMDVAGEAVQAGAHEGLVVAADEQLRGRGRRGRPWSSPPGAGLYLTFVFRPPPDEGAMARLALLTLAAGVAVREAILRATGLAAELKWPNDVIVGRRKLAGILSEGHAIGAPDQTVLVGVGINVRAAAHPGPIAARATSLESELGRATDRGRLLEELLVAVPHVYDQLRRGNADDILQAWRRVSPSARGRTVAWDGPGGVQRGTTAGIDATGALLVNTSHGSERVRAGELTWVT